MPQDRTQTWSRSLLLRTGTAASIGISALLAIILVGKWIRSIHSRSAHVATLEKYLSDRREGYDNRRNDSYQHTTDHLVAKLRMSPEDIFEAAKRSKHINIIARENAKGMAEATSLSADQSGPKWVAVQCVRPAKARRASGQASSTGSRETHR